MAILSKYTTIGGKTPLTTDINNIDAESIKGMTQVDKSGVIDANTLVDSGNYNFINVTEATNFPTDITVDYLNNVGASLCVLSINDEKCTQIFINESYILIRHKLNENSWSEWKEQTGNSNGENTSSIIDVIELPTNNIKENVFYKLMTCKVVINGLIFNEKSPYRCYCVNGLPEEGLAVTNDSNATINVYYNIQDEMVSGYVTDDLSTISGIPVGWYDIDAICQSFGETYYGIIYDSKDIIEVGYYILVTSSLYYYTDKWIKVTNTIGQDSTGYSAEIFNDYADNQASGEYSHAEGSQTKAEGICSHAEGLNNHAIGEYSHVEGEGNRAEGNCSHAEGSGTIVNSNNSHAEGSGTTANGPNSHAEGYHSITNGEYSHAEGYTTKANGESSHAEGNCTQAVGANSHTEGYITTGLGEASHVEGIAGVTDGEASHAEGYGVHAAGAYSHAEGSSTRAIGAASHAEGNYSEAEGEYSHAEGHASVALGGVSHAEGFNVVVQGEHSHGEGSTTRAIGHSVHSEGFYTHAGCKGYYWCSIDFNNNTITLTKEQAVEPTETFTIYYEVGDKISIVNNSKYEECSTITAINDNVITVDSLPFTEIVDIASPDTDDYSLHVPTKPDIGITVLGSHSHSEGEETFATERAAHSEGRKTRAIGQYSHAEGRETVAYYASHAEGYKTKAKSKYSHTEGYNTETTSNYSHAEGSSSKAIGEISHAEGSSTEASGKGSHAEGVNAIASGAASHSEGRDTQSIGRSSHAEGETTIAEGSYSHAEGYASKSIGSGSHAEGGASYAEGIYSHAEGQHNHANGNNSHAEGIGNQANGESSHAEGASNTVISTNAHVEGYGNIVGDEVPTGNATITLSITPRASDEEAGIALMIDNYKYRYISTKNNEYVVEEVNRTSPDANVSSQYTFSDYKSGFEIIEINNDAERVNLVEIKITEDIEKTMYGLAAHAEGAGNRSLADYSHTEGYHSEVLSNNAHSEGYFTKAGVRGYYWYSIDFENKTITLTKERGVEPTEIFTIGYAVGDVISIVNDNKYEECSKITAINNNIITVDSLPFTEVVNMTDFGIDDYSLHVPTKPGVGMVILGENSHAEGENTIAVERASHAEGRLTKAIGQYSHAEGRQTVAYYGSHAEGCYTKAISRAAHSEGVSTTASGDYSHAEGNGSSASGEASHAEGAATSANGYGSHAEGQNTNATVYASHAEGSITSASGVASHAEGTNTNASGVASHAEGRGTIASSEASHTEGSDTSANGYASHAEGQNTEATAYAAHAEGSGTTASGVASHAEGVNTISLKNSSHAEGYKTEANEQYSHSEGYMTKANGSASHAEGHGTIALGNEQHVEGRYNIEDTENKYAHIVGNGTSDTSHSNAHTLDWNGNGWYQGTIEASGIILRSSTDGSNKKFLLTVSDTGELNVTEITQA